jgi:hypothetical protein
MPGFSAEDSLYQPSGHYRRAAAGGAAQAGQVLPQQLVIDTRGSEWAAGPNQPPLTFWDPGFVSIQPWPSLRCLRTYNRCTSLCAKRAYPEVCRAVCSVHYQQCEAGQA